MMQNGRSAPSRRSTSRWTGPVRAGDGTPSAPQYSICELVEWKRTQTCVPTPHQVHAPIALLGKYAILSHRWDRNQELSFADINNLSDPVVQAKKGFKKLSGFSKVVESLYGCRYVWMDSACIDEADRNESIPHMFGWYRHAYACVIYLSTSAIVSKDPWSTIGWTLQEFLAASRIKCFTVLQTLNQICESRSPGLENVHAGTRDR
ncbi:hypothetical protein AB1N83_012310 [Pleurotus pulmonarius]